MKKSLYIFVLSAIFVFHGCGFLNEEPGSGQPEETVIRSAEAAIKQALLPLCVRPADLCLERGDDSRPWRRLVGWRSVDGSIHPLLGQRQRVLRERVVIFLPVDRSL